jgi:predicted RNA-binding protein with PUA-like domain
MNYWLLKTEPDTFGIGDLAKSPGGTSSWDGVRNYQARNLLRDAIKRGDRAFIYHSSCPQPGIAGTARVVRAGYPDHTAFAAKDPHFDPGSDPLKPRWFTIDVQLEQRFARLVSLDELRAHANKKLRGMVLLRTGNRLSVSPVDAAHWRFILALSRVVT